MRLWIGDPGGVQFLPERAFSFTHKTVLEELGEASSHWWSGSIRWSQFQHFTSDWGILALQLVPADSHKTSVFSHLGTAVAAAVSVLAMVTFAAFAAYFSSSAGVTVEEGGTNFVLNIWGILFQETVAPAFQIEKKVALELDWITLHSELTWQPLLQVEKKSSVCWFGLDCNVISFR